jgi:ATP-dependent Clp protease ATP-binding subunit ClpA
MPSLRPERDGDLEEAARLQYDQLHTLQQRREELEACQAEAQAAGTALLREQVEAGDIADLCGAMDGHSRAAVARRESGGSFWQWSLISVNGVIGQAEAVTAVAAAIRRARAGMKDSAATGGLVFVPWPDRCRKNGIGQRLWRHPCLMKKRHWYASI